MLRSPASTTPAGQPRLSKRGRVVKPSARVVACGQADQELAVEAEEAREPRRRVRRRTVDATVGAARLLTSAADASGESGPAVGTASDSNTLCVGAPGAEPNVLADVEVHEEGLEEGSEDEDGLEEEPLQPGAEATSPSGLQGEGTQ
jgi:hypothetical protein